MTWTYRVILTIGGKGTTHWYGYSITEVYYDKNGKVDGWVDPNEKCHPYGDTLAELRRDLALMRKALALPVLEERKGKLVEVESPVKATGKTRRGK